MVADVLVGLCGAWGLAGSLTWSFARTRRAMLAVQISTAPGFLLHWALQGHWTAAGMTVLTMLLTLISAALDGPPDSRGLRLARSLYLVALLPVVLLAACSWEGWHSLFAALGTAIACFGRWQTDKTRFRALIQLGALVRPQPRRWLGAGDDVRSLPDEPGCLACPAPPCSSRRDGGIRHLKRRRARPKQPAVAAKSLQK